MPAATRLGPYEIVGLVGSGGMGEVYRARDPRLGRDVAIKILPESLRANPERLRRFEQEARAAGALNHPNILAVLDAGMEDGHRYVVSELLEGETLRQRLRSGGGLTRPKAVECAIQVALGLAAAHDKGIVHRDLKPENLFLTKDGRVKILDFGLAKLREVHEEGEGGSEPETHSTEPGTVLGTVGYMSPEQVRGLSADHRSDIFSFGAVLYEMLARRRPFEGDSAPEVLTAILKEDPPDLSSGDASLSPALARIVGRCLEKRPEDRFHSARDVAFALEAVSAPWVVAAGDAERRRARWQRPAAALGGGLLLLSVLAVPAGLFSRQPPPSFVRLTFRRGIVTSARLTADGHTVAYAASWEGGGPVQVYSKRVEGRESARLDLPAADVLAISASGELALKRRHAQTLGRPNPPGTLARVPLTGTAVRDVLEGVVAADWSPDGRALAVVRTAGGRNRVEYPIGTLLLETDDEIRDLRVSPGGDRIALAAAHDEGARIDVVDLAGRRTTLTKGWRFKAAQVAWAPSGSEVWFTAVQTGWMASLRAVTLAGKEREVLRLPGLLQLHDISRDGRVLLTVTSARGEMYGRSPGQTRERDLSWYESSSPLGLSGDGSKLLFAEVAAGVGDTFPPLYLRGTEGSPAVPIGFGWPAALSGDARWVAACPGTPPFSSIKILPTGVGEERVIDLGKVSCKDLGWVPGGRRVFFTGVETGHRWRSYVVDVAGGAPQVLTPEGSVCTAVSPDGSALACSDAEDQTFIQPLAGGEPRPVRGLEPGETVGEWSADGRSLIVARWETLPLRVFLVDLVTGRRTLWREFQPADRTGVYDMVGLVVTRDLKGYVYRYRRNLSDLYLFDGLR